MTDLLASPATGREYTHSRAERHHRYLLPVVAEMLRDIDPSRKVLDIGCGNGYISGLLLQRGYDVTGIDVSKSSVQVATAALGPHFHVASAVDSRLPEIVGTGYAAVAALEVIEHIYSPSAFLETCRSVLGEGGALVITTPYHGYFKNLGLAATGRLESHFQPAAEGGHIKFWSRRTLEHVLRRHGFAPVAFRGCGRLPYLWKSMVIKSVKQ